MLGISHILFSNLFFEPSFWVIMLNFNWVMNVDIFTGRSSISNSNLLPGSENADLDKDNAIPVVVTSNCMASVFELVPDLI